MKMSYTLNDQQKGCVTFFMAVQHSGTLIDGGTLDEYYKLRTLENRSYFLFLCHQCSAI